MVARAMPAYPKLSWTSRSGLFSPCKEHTNCIFYFSSVWHLLFLNSPGSQWLSNPFEVGSLETSYRGVWPLRTSLSSWTWCRVRVFDKSCTQNELCHLVSGVMFSMQLKYSSLLCFLILKPERKVFQRTSSNKFQDFSQLPYPSEQTILPEGSFQTLWNTVIKQQPASKYVLHHQLKHRIK